MIDEEEVKQEIKTVDESIEDFSHDLGIAIYDLNKKHSNILHRTNLANHLTPYFVFIKCLREEREEREKREAEENAKIE